MIMGKSKSLNDIKRDIALITLDIECLDPGLKPAAIAHLEETIDLLKIGAGYDLATLANQNLKEEKKETTLEDAWMFNDDTFDDDIDHESNNETIPVQEKENCKNKSSIIQEYNEEMGKVLNQIPNNEIKQEPVVISMSPDTVQGQIASENDMIKCDPCNVYLPMSYTMKRHEEDPHHLARVSTVPLKQIDEMSVNESQKKSILKHQTISTGINTTATANICYICKKQYKNRESLRLHNNMHTGKNKCQKCKAHFTSRSKLKKHNGNPNNCLALQKIRSSRNLIESGLANTTERNQWINTLNEESSRPEVDMNLLQCPECPNQYNKKESLRKHRLIHTGKYKCPRCEAPFMERTKLDVHTRDPKSCTTLQKIRSSTKFIQFKY